MIEASFYAAQTEEKENSEPPLNWDIKLGDIPEELLDNSMKWRVKNMQLENLIKRGEWGGNNIFIYSFSDSCNVWDMK